MGTGVLDGMILSNVCHAKPFRVISPRNLSHVTSVSHGTLPCQITTMALMKKATGSDANFLGHLPCRASGEGKLSTCSNKSLLNSRISTQQAQIQAMFGMSHFICQFNNFSNLTAHGGRGASFKQPCPSTPPAGHGALVEDSGSLHGSIHGEDQLDSSTHRAVHGSIHRQDSSLNCTGSGQHLLPPLPPQFPFSGLPGGLYAWLQLWI